MCLWLEWGCGCIGFTHFQSKDIGVLWEVNYIYIYAT